MADRAAAGRLERRVHAPSARSSTRASPATLHCLLLPAIPHSQRCSLKPAEPSLRRPRRQPPAAAARERCCGLLPPPAEQQRHGSAALHRPRPRNTTVAATPSPLSCTPPPTTLGPSRRVWDSWQPVTGRPGSAGPRFGVIRGRAIARRPPAPPPPPAPPAHPLSAHCFVVFCHHRQRAILCC